MYALSSVSTLKTEATFLHHSFSSFGELAPDHFKPEVWNGQLMQIARQLTKARQSDIEQRARLLLDHGAKFSFNCYSEQSRQPRTRASIRAQQRGEIDTLP
jgi:hypothetical protein